MTRANFAVAGLLLAATAIVPAAKAVTVEVLAVGASASWQTAAIGAFNQLAGAGAEHYTIKGTCTSGNCASVHDVRSTSIPLDAGNLWVVWNKAGTQVWAYVSVDAIVGIRAYMANPRAQLQIDPETETIPGQNLIATSLWGSDASALPAAIYTALNNAPFTVAFSGLRPEDGKFIASRVLSPLNTTTYAGLGYGTGPTDLVGTEILSSYSSSTANPVDFNIKGTDPFSQLTVKTWKTVNVGAQASVFVINRKDANGLGAGVSGGIPVFTDLPDSVAQTIFEGTECDTDAFNAVGAPANVPITAVLTEPLGANANVVEYTIFRDKANPDGSQEEGVNPANPGNNPLNLPCATVNGVAGNRRRAVGVSEDVSSGIAGSTVTDAIAYVSFSYGNISKLAGSPSYGYLTRNGIDGIQTSGVYPASGELPTCASPCPVTPGTSFPNVRNGTYKDWTIVTTITAASGAALTKTVLLVNAIQNNLNQVVPDFVPFAAVGGDPGLKVYRSHYLQSGYAPNNGLGGQKEAGGDVGGCIEPVGPPPGVLSCHQ
jgi:hypothetical protein